MKQLRQYQRLAYELPVSNAELYSQIKTNMLPSLEEMAMYETSLKIQPRV